MTRLILAFGPGFDSRRLHPFSPVIITDSVPVTCDPPSPTVAGCGDSPQLRDLGAERLPMRVAVTRVGAAAAPRRVRDAFQAMRIGAIVFGQRDERRAWIVPGFGW